MPNNTPNQTKTSNQQEPQQKGNINSDYTLLQNNLDNLNRRLKLSDEKQIILSKKVEFLEQNMVTFEKTATSNLKNLKEELEDLKNDFSSIKEKLAEILEQMKNVARKESVDEIIKYLDTWSPIHFVTEDDVKRIVEEKFEDKIGEGTLIFK